MSEQESMRYVDPPEPSHLGMLVSSLAVLIILGIVAWGLYMAQKPPAFLLQGVIQSDEVRVSLKLTGRVQKLMAREGDQVRAGQVLARISSPEMDAAVAGADRAAAANTLAQATWQRVARLYKKGVVPAQKRDEARAGAKAAGQALKAAQAKVRAMADGARIAPDGAALDVLAPVSGEVSARAGQIGELVVAGYPIFTLIDLNDVWLMVNLREDQFHALKMGQVIKGEIPALNRTAKFRVSFIKPLGDFATWRAVRQSSGYDVRSFEIRARPVSPVAGLRPGMSVLVHSLKAE